MYKLYIKENSSYKGPKIYDSYRQARDHAKGEYIIIKHENNTDEVVEHGEKEEWER